ncbi:EAL domain-containing protein [Rhodopseudomonas sp. P2A-2r]|uniref:bifunctional diguanylate cyclase/phosphodiesterase n=1 Tax=Rhodopseudomonas sp. P2A-2r TaxID=2991972 RepID=UPI0022347784|nr:EAL domain-containing protein [Rhodopseudomonas sp. P2A-2r]UZE52357.1 EAL domain-containing protein [Rhodopseudomonas sp. P2A-2r]
MNVRIRERQLGNALTRRNPVGWLLATGAVAIVAIALATTMAVDSFRARALASSQRELENTLLLLSRHFQQDFSDLKRTEEDLAAFLQSGGIVSAEHFRERMSGPEAHRLLKAKMSTTGTGSINVLDADGHLIGWSTSWPAPVFNFADRTYFQRAKAAPPEADDEIVEPILSRTTGTRKTLFARRLSASNGDFLGVVTRGIEPAQFEAFFASISLGTGTTLALWHQDFTLLARYPQLIEMVGHKAKPDALLAHMKASPEPATMISVSPVDGRERLSSIRRISGFPMALVASVPIDSALADWRAQTRLTITAAALAALLVVGLLSLIIRQVRLQHRASRAQLTLEKQRLDTAVNNMTQGLILFDAESRVVVVNQSYLDMYRLSAGAVRPGSLFRDAVAVRHANGSLKGDIDAYCSQMTLAVDSSTAITADTLDGRVIQILPRSIAGGGWVATHEDITERHHAEDRIAHLAHYDALTDLPNRTLFRNLLDQELTRLPRDRNCAVIYIDMDEFKGINDSLGHPVGDALLQAVAQRLRGCVSSPGVVARLGGDEFAIVQTDLGDRDETVALVARIHEAIREPFECLGHRLLTDASIGIALAPQDGTDIDQLLRNADLAMYGAKADGRRTYRFFEPRMDASIQARRTLEQELREAIADGSFVAGGFEVHYQPLLRLADDAVSGCEALLRWRHPVRGMISPAEFIPIAEEIGVVDEIGEWVLATACAEAANWPDDIKIAVNVSPIQFRSQSLALKVSAALAQSGLCPQRLELEITEAVLIRDDEAALDILHRLRALGVRIALDDFGTGYSSLSYLQRFPFDKIKIDRCFVTDIAEIDGSPAIVQAVVNIAASRNMTTTAEGVETEAQKQLLRALGCTEIQGWLFSPAKPAAEVRALMAHHRANAVAA